MVELKQFRWSLLHFWWPILIQMNNPFILVNINAETTQFI